MRHIFIINPRAGRQDSTARIYAMADELRKRHGLTVDCLLTQSPGHATELARRLAAEGQPLRLYACGGDGTVGEVAAGIAGCDNAAFTCIPVGTGNDFLKNFGDKASLFADAEHLWDGPVLLLDTIDCNGRTALTIVCAGIDARIAADVHHFSRRPVLAGQKSYIAALVLNFLCKDINSQWRVTVDGLKLTGSFALAAACNGRYYGGGFMPSPQAGMTDGQLEVVLVKGASRVKFAALVGDYKRGDGARHAELVTTLSANDLLLEADKEIVTCLDGEVLRDRRIHIRLGKQQVRFFGPVGCNPDATRRIAR